VPGIYVHSMLGSPNDQAGFAHTGRARSLNREKWELGELKARIADPARREGAVLRRMIGLLGARRTEPAFHPSAPQRVLSLGDGLFALERQGPDGPPLLCLHNVAATPQRARLNAGPGARYVDLLGGGTFTAAADGALAMALGPYQALWLKAEARPGG
jgi:hypothetical protein